MYIKTFPMQPYGVNSYLAWNADGTALVVDCGGQPDVLVEHLQAYSLKLTAILLTHLHHDHVLGVATLAAQTGAPVFASAADAVLVETDSDSPDAALPAVPPFAFKDIRHGRATFLGEPCLVLPVPGHTPGHLAYFFPKTLTAFTGDTLFRGSVGRTDSPYGDASLLLESIRSRLLVLPDAVELFPGHGPSTTVGREKAENPFFAPK
ncbi:MBL fold metallo-hydrolase [Desulfovibrio aerotolerans]|uniref:MBL fold metallo-hydrolase n=1 Tax=Solidesulfovibrio aerotolerans TaxID=295255 RepID=A0A7C9ILV2_9BACT|nr:MBL fold metallo-hydrolase [Solidesulfovibrio aerotolerans]MYL83146.1 MBL fold metallo-hydrolase [Solidesulfovibrio aerotolerans]